MGGNFKVVSIDVTISTTIGISGGLIIRNGISTWNAGFMLVSKTTLLNGDIIHNTYSVSTHGETGSEVINVQNSSNSEIPAGDYKLLKLVPIT